MNALNPNKFATLAKRYVWWENVEWACAHPTVLLSNIMNLGDWDAWVEMRQLIDETILKEVLRNPPPGYFTQRSWDYWNYEFGINPIPPLPKREFK